MPSMSTVQRISLLNISHRNNTFCIWDQLVGGWPLFSPPGASIRHAGPGPEPKPGWEAEPRHWHRDKKSDPLPGPWHHLLVGDTGQIERDTQREREIRKRLDMTHNSCCFPVLAFDKREVRQDRREMREDRVTAKEKKRKHHSESQSKKWHSQYIHFGMNIKCLIHQTFWYVKYISSPCCLVCSLLLKQVGNKGKLLVCTFSFFFLKNSFRLCQQVSKQFLKLSLQTLFTRKTCHEAKHTLQKPAAAMDFFSIFHEANLTASRGPRKQDPLFECPQSKRYSVYSYAQERINLWSLFSHTVHIMAETSGNQHRY